MQNNTSDKIKQIVAMTIFGTIGLVRRYIPYPSSVIAFIRGAIGSLFLLLVHFIRRDKFDGPAIKKNIVLLCISGALIGANWICLFEAYRYTSVSAATVCYYMAPVFVILVSPIVLKEAITLKKGLCALVAVGGMILVSGVIETGLSGITGVLFGLAAAVMYAIVVILNKFIKDISANDRTLIQLAAAAIAILPYVLLTEKGTVLDTSWFVLLMVAVAGIVHTGIAYSLYFGSMKGVPAQTLALLSYIDPIIAVLLSVVVLKEAMSLPAAIGVVLVIGATIVSEVQISRKKAAAEI